MARKGWKALKRTEKGGFELPALGDVPIEESLPGPFSKLLVGQLLPFAHIASPLRGAKLE